MIEENLKRINTAIETTARRCGRDPSSIKLVAVSKRFPVEMINKAHAAGHTLFGENYIQEAAEKRNQLIDEIRLHFIGNLQHNKAKIAASIFTMIETIDRFKIAAALDRHLQKIDRSLDILVQVNIALDPRKSGVSPEDTAQLVKRIQELPHLRLRGLMTMPPFTEDPEQARPYFRKLRLLAEDLQAKELLSANDRIELSMGMSNDFHVAIEEGATIIRVGTAIFGTRL